MDSGGSAWEAAVSLLMSDLGGMPVEKIEYLTRHHRRPERGLTCWRCSQTGSVSWPCPPHLIAREAAFRLRLDIPKPREATP